MVEQFHQDPCILAPTEISEAVQILSEVASEVVIVSSAGHLMARQARSAWRPSSLVLNVQNLNELKGIHRQGNLIRIGALATFHDLAQSRLVQRRAAGLFEAARLAGGPQGRHRHTLGGEIMAGSPGGEGLAALLASGARVVLLSNEGPRSVPLYAFYTGYRKPVATASELLTCIEVPVSPPTSLSYHRKAAPRGGYGLSKVTLCGQAVLGPTPADGRKVLKQLRLGMAAVAPIPTRLFETERFLMSQPLTSEHVEQATRVLASEISPIDDYWSTAAYRRLVATNMLRDFLLPLT